MSHVRLTFPPQLAVGKPLTPLITHESLEARLEKNIKRDSDGGCWWWIGAGSGKYYKKDDKSGYLWLLFVFAHLLNLALNGEDANRENSPFG